MSLVYSLSQEDYVIHQLFLASEQPSIKSKRNKSRIVLPIFMFVLAGFMFVSASTLFLEFIYIILGILWYIFYPKYSAYKYKKHYQKYIAENYLQKVNLAVELEIQDEYLLAIDPSAESKIKAEQFEKINELRDYYLVRLVINSSILIPKKSGVKQGDASEFVSSLATRYNIPVIDNQDWEWK